DYACLFGDVDINDSRYNKLKAYIENHFKDYTKPLCSINAFIGLYLRMDLLDKLGWTDILVNDINEFFLHMVDITGTLWEYRDMNIGSLDHGFASYIATLLPKQ
ncbi:MAG: hypothetical protein MJ236_02265, partial [Clostridia bacterium]|nr:hypothetical protein [Clostridia bacterium]